MMTLHKAVDQAARLYEDELLLRARAREVELVQSRSEEARRLFRRASAARRIRLALLRRWRLV